MDTGYEVFSLLNIIMREFHANKGNAQNWNALKTSIGFTHYSDGEARAISGNDFMLIASSHIIKKDMRLMFDIW